jgi:hypothetical protein
VVLAGDWRLGCWALLTSIESDCCCVGAVGLDEIEYTPPALQFCEAFVPTVSRFPPGDCCVVRRGAVFLAYFGGLVGITFAPRYGAAAGLLQRGTTLMMLPCFIFGAIALIVNFSADTPRNSLSQVLIVVTGLCLFIGLPWALGDFGEYLTIILVLALFVPWSDLLMWIRKGMPQEHAVATGLNTSQLMILWLGTLLAQALCIVWAVVANSLGPLVLAVILLTVLLVASARPSRANKRAVAAAAAAFLGTVTVLRAGFLFFQYLSGNGTEGLIEPGEVQLSNVEWSRLLYPGVISVRAKVKNASNFELKTFEIELTVEQRGNDPEKLSDTVSVDLAPGQEKEITHFFPRPTLGRDPHNFFFLRSMFADTAQLSWKITKVTAGS